MRIENRVQIAGGVLLQTMKGARVVERTQARERDLLRGQEDGGQEQQK